MRLDLLAELLEAADLGVIGESIFTNRMNADSATAILLRAPLDGIPMDENLPGYHRHYIQVIIRAPNQQTGDDLAVAVQAALTFHNRRFAADDGTFQMFISRLYPQTLPRSYPRLEGQGIEWAQDFDACYVLPLI